VTAAARPVTAAGVRLSQPAGRWVLLAAILGSGIAMLDATVVNIALPAIDDDLGAGLGGLQWTVNGYALPLAALILLGGSLGDRLGRRRVFVIGAGWFAVASLLCAAAPTIEALVAARALQGVGGALLTPGSLAIISASFHPDDRGRAIGAWSGLGGITGAVGPFLGGYLIDALSWRWIFLLNLPIAAVVIAVASRHVPETSDPEASPRLDAFGAALGALGLGGVTYALVAAGDGGDLVAVAISGGVGAAALAAFVVTERRSSHPMMPLDVFASRQFTAANLVTFVVYGALGGVLFLLVLHLQVVAGFSPLAAGTSLLPVTVIMLLGSARAGALAQRIGPRLPMAAGPLVSAAGLLLMTRIGVRASYVGAVLPAVVVFGLGLTLTVAPLTTAVLAAASTRHAGVASGVNNAVARAAGLLAVAALPLAAGLTQGDYQQPTRFADGFVRAIAICAVLLATGGLLAAATIRNDVTAHGLDAAPQLAAGDGHRVHCSVDGPPLHADADPAARAALAAATPEVSPGGGSAPARRSRDAGRSTP
jgi:EmrB/QacA subfamily drug resistance transporter